MNQVASFIVEVPYDYANYQSYTLGSTSSVTMKAIMWIWAPNWISMGNVTPRNDVLVCEVMWNHF
jgi:hypothetical protein